MDGDKLDEVADLINRFRKNEIESVKDDISDKVQEDMWLGKLRMKCREYIKNNGTKTTTIEEVLSCIRDEAFNTFPKDVMLELLDDICNNKDFRI